MNRLFRKYFWLTAMVISVPVPTAFADDLFDDSFFADPAPVDAAKPAEDKAAAPDVAQAPAVTPETPAVAEAPLDTAVVAEAPAAAETMPELDIPAAQPDMAGLPVADAAPALDVPPPATNDLPVPAPMDFGGPSNSEISLSTPPSENILGKVSSDVFREMAEMERENNALMLQLKREQLRSEIDALKTNNRQILFDEIERREKMTQARLEWELAQDLKRQEAMERKQRAEIRQKQIEAALKREEDRRIKLQKDEEEARLRKEEEAKAAEEKKRAELKKKYDAASIVKVNNLKPVLMSASRPEKIKRSPSTRVSMKLTEMGEDMLNRKKAGEALISVETTAAGDKDEEDKNTEAATTLYAVSEIRGTAGALIAKLVSKKDKTTFFAKKATILPTGHTVIDIDKDFVLVQLGNKKEMIGFPSAGLLTPPTSSRGDNDPNGRSRDEEALRREREEQRRMRAPVAASSGVGSASFSGASLAR